MGGGRSFCGVAVVAMMLTTILCSTHCCRGSILSRANATYREVTVELVMDSDIRQLFLENVEVKTGKTVNPNSKACDNGKGNCMGRCYDNPNKKIRGDSYEACKQ